MSGLTSEQQDVVDAPMAPMCVIACAGSGKTKTAVQRLVQMRRNLGEARGRVALLSFSNVAVNTFRKAYDELANTLPSGTSRSRVEIDTLDGFITSAILHPHGHRTMGAARAAFLVTGGESFLAGFTFPTATYPKPVADLHTAIVGGAETFFHLQGDTQQPVPAHVARSLITRLGKVGAYTHDLGRYWAYRVLKERPELVRVIARRYPYILIDEAQDIGSVHQAILEILIAAGCCVTLIGDPNQGIYAFAGADGLFLRKYYERAEVLRFALTRNFRSVPIIVGVANGLCARSDVAERSPSSKPHGAFFIGYKRDEHAKLVAAFRSAMELAGTDIRRSAILCRGNGLADQVRGDEAPAGQGTVKLFATAAVLRDRKRDFLRAFQRVAVAVVCLLEKPPQGLVSQITQPARFPEWRALRREIWTFTRDSELGLPPASLPGDTQWHPKLVVRTKALLARLEAKFSLAPADNLGGKLKKTGLTNAPLLASKDLVSEEVIPLRVDTVHQAKGESLDAVLYMTLKDHAEELLAGVGTEVGRVGYVAATRAKDLLWLAVPTAALKELRPLLVSKGFQEIGAPSSKEPKPKASAAA